MRLSSTIMQEREQLGKTKVIRKASKRRLGKKEEGESAGSSGSETESEPLAQEIEQADGLRTVMQQFEVEMQGQTSNVVQQDVEQSNGNTTQQIPVMVGNQESGASQQISSQNCPNTPNNNIANNPDPALIQSQQSQQSEQQYFIGEPLQQQQEDQSYSSSEESSDSSQEQSPQQRPVIFRKTQPAQQESSDDQDGEDQLFFLDDDQYEQLNMKYKQEEEESSQDQDDYIDDEEELRRLYSQRYFQMQRMMIAQKMAEKRLPVPYQHPQMQIPKFQRFKAINENYLDKLNKSSLNKEAKSKKKVQFNETITLKTFKKQDEVAQVASQIQEQQQINPKEKPPTQKMLMQQQMYEQMQRKTNAERQQQGELLRLKQEEIRTNRRKEMEEKLSKQKEELTPIEMFLKSLSEKSINVESQPQKEDFKKDPLPLNSVVLPSNTNDIVQTTNSQPLTIEQPNFPTQNPPQNEPPLLPAEALSSHQFFQQDEQQLIPEPPSHGLIA